jgi:SpoVK/Ycf46/Vps4 family AAA+-type ATPase
MQVQTDTAIELRIDNRTPEAKQVRIDETLPETYTPSNVRVEKGGEIIWSAADRKQRLAVAVELDPHGERVVRYAPRAAQPTAFSELADRTARITRVRPIDSSDDGGTYSLPKTDADPAVAGEDIIGSDHEYIDPPPATDFADVAGLDAVKRELRTEIIEPFTDPRYDHYDIGKANGVLLYGPPGTGKTHVATAIAGELGFNFLEAEMSMLRSSTVGSNVENVKQLFEMARSHQPCVVFIDEIDSLAPVRDESLHQSRQEAVNELLQQVADINEQDTDVLVIAATNRPEQVDDALKRTGRFDTRIKIGIPDEMTRIAILEQELRSFDGAIEPIWADPAFLDAFVAATTNFSASDVIEVVESAQRASLRTTDSDEEPVVTAELLMEQIETVGEKQEADTAGEFLTETPEIDFSDVGGLDATKEQLKEKLLTPLEKGELYAEYGLETTNGVLLYGPPGTGKTYLSKAVAGEAECSFLSLTAADIVSKWIGEAAQNIQELFETAKQVEPAIIFIDEIDAIAGKRRGSQQTNSEAQAVNELLAQISALDETDVFVIAATNKPESIDDAVTRSGRLGERIEVPPPGAEARVKIIKAQLADRPVDSEQVDWESLKTQTEPGPNGVPYVAADLAKIVNEAARYALEEAEQDALQPIAHRHLEQATETVDPSLTTIESD